jgi:type II secretory pathway pseudopilin PulG
MPMNRKAQGFALIDVIFVCGMIGLLCSIALPRFMLAKSAAGAASAIGSLRAINSAELTFALTCGSGFYAPNLTRLGIAPPGSNEPFIGGGLGAADSVFKSGYVVKIEGTAYDGAPASCNGLPAGQTARGFKAGADPADPVNQRYFGSNANNAIYEDTSSLYAGMPESGEPPAGHPLR